MKIIERGTKPPLYPWIGRYRCVYCKSVLELTEEDAREINDAGEDQLDGRWVHVRCPVCEQQRTLQEA